MKNYTITVLMTCHNRKYKTLTCLEALLNGAYSDDIAINVVLCDDGSSDGTTEVVLERFPGTNVIHGNGSLFWNKGMHKAFEEGKKLPSDFYLFLNDDTLLFNDSLQKLVITWRGIYDCTGRDAIIVGTTCDSLNGKATYGGVYRPSSWKPTTFSIVEPTDHPQTCETMNCNCVLLPRSIADAVGNFDPRYAHSMGDFDYAFRARKLGYEVFVAPGFIGTCDKNDTVGTYNDPCLTPIARWKKMMHPKGLPPFSWYVYTSQHAGKLWPIFWLWPYLRLASKIAKGWGVLRLSR